MRSVEEQCDTEAGDIIQLKHVPAIMVYGDGSCPPTDGDLYQKPPVLLHLFYAKSPLPWPPRGC